MIYLHGPGVLFLHTRKCAGTSFETALSHFAGPDDIITLYPNREREEERRRIAGNGARNYGFERGDPIPQAALERSVRLRHIPEKFHNHMTAEETREKLGEERWNASRRISIVRNPFDLAVSFYFWRMHGRAQTLPFDDWCHANLAALTANRDIYSIAGEIAVQHLFRYERLSADIAAFEREVPSLAGLGAFFGRMRAKSGVRPVHATAERMFAEFPAAVPVIAGAFAEEIDRFGYSLG